MTRLGLGPAPRRSLTFSERVSVMKVRTLLSLPPLTERSVGRKPRKTTVRTDGQPDEGSTVANCSCFRLASDRSRLDRWVPPWLSAFLTGSIHGAARASLLLFELDCFLAFDWCAGVCCSFGSFGCLATWHDAANASASRSLSARASAFMARRRPPERARAERALTVTRERARRQARRGSPIRPL